jgi:two-component system response regulator HydG
VVVTAFGSLETAIAAIRAGAYDFLTKPLALEVLEVALERAIQHRRLQDEVRRLRREVEVSERYEELLGSSPVMTRLFRTLERVAVSDAAVLIRGETGTGKELVARAIHRRGRRREGPLVALNCAAIPETLLESELFGHARGAFTGAAERREGLLLTAHRGTLFLDEVGDMPLATQAKLLRVLQERRVRPVGSDQERAADVRVLAATHRDLEAALEEGRFRQDLYFRLNVIGVELPALRERGNDVLLLAQHFLARAAARAGKQVLGLTPHAAERLLAWTWPGNVRELENCIERAVALTQHERLLVDDLPERVRLHRPTQVVIAAEDPTTLLPMEEVERRYVLEVLRAVQGHRTRAARILGFDRKTLYRKLERWGVSDAGAPD